MSNEHPDGPVAGAPTQGGPGRPSRRPSLNVERDSAAAAATPTPGGESSTSILHALSSTMQMPPVSFTAARPPRWRPWAVAAIAVGLAAAGWAAYVASRADVAPAPDPLRVAAPAMPAARTAAPPPAQAVVTTDAASSSGVTSAAPAASAVARIEDLPPAALAGAAAAAAAVPSPAPAVPVVQPVATAATSVASTAVAPAVPTPAARPDAPRVARYEAPAEARIRPRSDAGAPSNAEAPRRKDVKIAMVDGRVAESPAQAAARTVSSSSTRQDSDVDLMAALLDHMAATEPTRAGQATPGVRKAAAAAPSPVAARPTTISGLVASCKQAGDKRAVTECRKRICKGYWGKADACPARLAPQAAARKRSAG